LKKLQAIIQEGTQLFDEVLTALFMRKIQAELAVFQVGLTVSVLYISDTIRLTAMCKFHVIFQVRFQL